MLPDILTPFKHYNEETISGVLDDIVTPEDEDSETCPSEDTMILPLLDENLDPASAHELRISIAEKNDISERTVRRYVSTYREKGFDGLKPAERTYYSKDNKPENYDELLEDAIQLRREVPRRSVEQIILILESEGKVAPGVLKRSTMQRHLFNVGFGASHMDVYSDARKNSSKRFCKPHRMMLIQGDIKYGPKLPIVEDTFRKAILKYGRFDKCYFDNGSQYVAKQLKLSLALRKQRPKRYVHLMN